MLVSGLGKVERKESSHLRHQAVRGRIPLLDEFGLVQAKMSHGIESGIDMASDHGRTVSN
jgi:hypothetical protein